MWLVGAVPSVGFTTDVENAGPEKVEVEFDSEDSEARFKAYFQSGQLIVDIDEDLASSESRSVDVVTPRVLRVVSEF